MKIDETIVAVITGGADGIGLCLAELLSAAGASLALVDIRQDPLDKAKARLLSKATVSTHVVDVRDRDGIAKARDEILAIHGRVNMLINSAGVFSVGAFENLTYADFDRVLNINLNGTINMCMEFFPVLKKEKEAFIINLSSVDGLIAMPNAGPYVTSKFAVTGFTRSLQMECDLTNPHIHVACVHPGFISTNIVNNNLNHLKLDTKNVPDKMRDYFSSEAVHNFQLKVASTTPMQCAEHILSGVRWNRSRIVIGTDAVIFDLLQRLMPSAFHSKYLFYPLLTIILLFTKFVGIKVIIALISIIMLKGFSVF